MATPLHRIQQQRFILDFATEKEAARWNRDFGAFNDQELIPHIAAVLDTYGATGTFYQVGSLEIDVGSVRMEELVGVLIRKLKKALDARIKSDTLKRSIPKRNSPENSVSVRNVPERSTPSKEEVIAMDSNDHFMAVFYHFLEYGIFPWNSALKKTGELEAAVASYIPPDKLVRDPRFLQLMQQPTVRQRLYYQFSNAFVMPLLEQLYGRQLLALSSLRQSLIRVFTHFAAEGASRDHIAEKDFISVARWIAVSLTAKTVDWQLDYFAWSMALAAPYLSYENDAQLLNALKLDVPSDLIRQWQQRYGSTGKRHSTATDVTVAEQGDKEGHKDGSDKAYEGITADTDVPDVTGTADGWDVADLPAAATEPAADDTEDIRILPDIAGNSAAAVSGLPDIPEESPGDGSLRGDYHPADATGTASTPTGQSGDAPGVDDGMAASQVGDSNSTDLLSGYYPDYAGVVLCWPYLNRLFEALGYLHGEAFGDITLQERAVHLLAFIATGREGCEEHELLMIKFLCSWPLHMPILRDLKLEQKEKEEVRIMLENMISNWSALKNTSVAGLQEAFFNRAGKLLKEEDHWRLIVAPKSYDMLLDRLPYPLSVIRLPWMQTLLRIDWA